MDNELRMYLDSLNNNLSVLNNGMVNLNQVVAGMKSAGKKPDNPFSIYKVDLTTAHTHLQITNQTPFDYLQVYCDGSLDGISIRMGDQSADPVDLKQMVAIPITTNPRFMYLSNDVRQGRSRITIYWVRGEKLSLAQGGQDISLTELAVRNGSIHYFDRRGDIVFQDDFQSTLIDGK